jgi:hypothetical protein
MEGIKREANSLTNIQVPNRPENVLNHKAKLSEEERSTYRNSRCLREHTVLQLVAIDPEPLKAAREWRIPKLTVRRCLLAGGAKAWR